MNYVIRYTDKGEVKELQSYNYRGASALLLEILKDYGRYTLLSFTLQKRKDERRK